MSIIYQKKPSIYFGIIVAVFLSTLPFSVSTSHATFPINWDCFLPQSSVDCETLRKAFFSSATFTSQVSIEKASLVIHVRHTPIQKGTQYSLDFEGTGSLPTFTILDRVPDTVTTETTTIRLISDLQKGLSPYLALLKPGTTANKTLTLSFTDPNDQTQEKPRDDDSDTNWFASPSISGNYSKGNNTSNYLNARFSANYSDPTWRIQANTSADYQKIKLDYAGETITAETFNYGGRSIVSYSFKEKWSVATILGYAHAPKQNLDNTVIGAVGLEWNLVPFKTTQEKVVAIRYTVSEHYQDYEKPNILDQEQSLFLKHSVEAYFAWNFEKFTVSTTLFGDSLMRDLSYLAGGASGSITWRVTNNILISLYGSLSYQKKYINAPLAEETSDSALEQYITGGNFKPLNIYTGLSLSYTFGNSLLKGQDQRWNAGL